MAKRSRFRIAGRDAADKIRQLVGRGDVRRVCLIDEEKSILETPMMTGDPASPATVLAAQCLRNSGQRVHHRSRACGQGA